jgi:hypothetical protein
MIAAKEQCIVFAQPCLDDGEPAAIPSSLHFGNQRRLVAAGDIDVDVMAFALVASRAR